MKILSPLLLLVAATPSSHLFAQPGSLDPSFGTNGIVTTMIGTNQHAVASGVAVQPDGKIVVAGDATILGGAQHMALARYLTDGELDASFGSGGVVAIPIGIASDAFGMVLQPDGRILLGGHFRQADHFDLAVVRYDPDGTLDGTFGVGGLATTPIGGFISGALSITLQPDGKILLGGDDLLDDQTHFEFAIVRFDQDGTLDPGFGTGGIVTTMVGTNCAVHSIIVQPDDRIVVTGVAEVNGVVVVVTARYGSDGTLDGGFGTGGVVTTDPGTGFARGNSVTLQQDGKILVAGSTATNGGVLLRYDITGALDPAFGTGGSVMTDPMECFAMALQADGHIAVAGFSSGQFALASYLPDGTLDNGFGSGGLVTTPMSNASAQAIAIQPDGKMILAGADFGTATAVFAVARYLSAVHEGIHEFRPDATGALVYPDPFSTTATFQYSTTIKEQFSLQLFDANARLVKTFFSNAQRSAGTHSEMLDLSGITSGGYILVLDNGEDKVSVRVMKP